MVKIKLDNNTNLKVYDRLNHKELNPITFYIRPERIRFSFSTIQRMNISVGSKILFLEFGDWYICQANGNPNGYLVQKDSKRAGASISASIISRAILRKIAPGKDRCECVIENTNMEYHGKPVFKIVNRQTI